MAGPIREAIKDKLQDDHPLIAAAIKAIGTSARRETTTTTPADVPQIVEDFRTAIAASPRAAAAANVEPAWQNRVKVGLVVIGVGAVLKLVNTGASSWWEENQDTITNVVVAGGAALAVLGEWLSAWLPGIDWRRPWTILGIGRAR